VIKKRGNRWWVAVYAGRDPLTGKKRQKTGTAASKAEARQLEARLISQVGAGQHRGAAGKTVADLIEAWFQWRPSVRPISPNTLVNYRRHADQKLLPALGRLPLNRVDTATIDRFYAELRQRGSKCQHCYRRMREGQPPMRPGEVFRLIYSGEERVHQSDCVQAIPMTASAIRDVHAVLSGAFKQAMVWGWISHNPVPLTTPPAVEQPDTRPPEVGQAGRLIERAMAEDPRARPVPGLGRGAGRTPRGAVQPALVRRRLRPGRHLGCRQRDHPSRPATPRSGRDQDPDQAASSGRCRHAGAAAHPPGRAGQGGAGRGSCARPRRLRLQPCARRLQAHPP
jgi:hypothetical protein